MLIGQLEVVAGAALCGFLVESHRVSLGVMSFLALP